MAPYNLCSHQCPYYDIWGTTRPLIWSQGCGHTGLVSSFLRKLVNNKVSVGIQTEKSGPGCDMKARDLSLLDGTAHTGEVIDPLAETVIDPLAITQKWVDLTKLGGLKVGIPDVSTTDSTEEVDKSSRARGQASLWEGVGKLGVRVEELFEEEDSLETAESRGESIEYLVFLPNKSPPCPICGEFPGTISKLFRHLQARHKKILVHFSCQRCGRRNLRPHPILVHAGKCKGEDQTGSLN